MIKGHLQVRFLPLGGFRLKNVGFGGKIWHLVVQKALIVNFSYYSPQKAHP